MILAKFYHVPMVLLTVCSLTFAQLPAQTDTDSATAAKDEKEKARLELEGKAFRLAESIASEGATLKLAENRAFILAMSGDLLWKQDQKRARSLFRDAAAELIAANAESEKTENDSPAAMFGFMNSPRRQILQTIARRDADLALELLVQTRSAKVAAEMARAAQPEQPAQKEEPASPFGMGRNAEMQAREEVRIEQSFAAQAAEQDPARAAKMLRASLSKGVSFEALSIITKIHKTDYELANALLAEVAQKLMDADFSKRMSQESNLAVNLLQQYGLPVAVVIKDADQKKTTLKLDQNAARDLAGKIADSLLKATDFTASFQFSRALPIIEKILPERAAALNQKQAALKKTMPEQMRSFDGLSALSDPNAAPEKIIAESAKMPAGMRGMMYRRAADKMAEKGEAERAKQLLNSQPVSKERDDALAYVDGKLAEKAAKDGKFDEARKLIQTIGTKTAQIEQLVKLAIVFHRKNDKESRETAVKIMDEARVMIDQTPQSDDEIQQLVQVVAGFAVIDSPKAFSLLEPFVDQANELLQAAALLAKYQKGQRNYRDGEMVMATGLGQMRGQMRFVKELGMLAAADFERARGLADRFARADARLLVRLLIAQSVLNSNQNINDTFGGVSGGDATFVINN